MQPLEQRVYEALAAGSPNTNAGQRVYPLLAPEGAALPRITFSRVSTAPVNAIGGSSGLDQVRVQIDCWASSLPAVATLAAQARTIIETQDFKALLQGAVDDYEPDTRTFRRSLDFRCWDHLN